mmetsp:Transcript_26361/g.65348  ORF Transcript_26361/g.65348 Transcript_26361/m.65348 type:complete len:212 (+) Transcript_26361:271-906(+)
MAPSTSATCRTSRWSCGASRRTIGPQRPPAFVRFVASFSSCATRGTQSSPPERHSFQHSVKPAWTAVPRASKPWASTRVRTASSAWRAPLARGPSTRRRSPRSRQSSSARRPRRTTQPTSSSRSCQSSCATGPPANRACARSGTSSSSCAARAPKHGAGPRVELHVRRLEGPSVCEAGPSGEAVSARALLRFCRLVVRFCGGDRRVVTVDK